MLTQFSSFSQISGVYLNRNVTTSIYFMFNFKI